MEHGDQDVGAMAVLIAVERTHMRVVETLMGIAVNANFRENMGQTSLHRATHGRHEVLVRFLVAKVR